MIGVFVAAMLCLLAWLIWQWAGSKGPARSWAVTLGVLMHAFGWSDDAYDPLAQGMLAGHLIEWGAQCTGGLVTPATVAEQRLYDIGDPRA